MIRWILGGLAGAAAGVAVWVAVGYVAHYEVGWIAWGVGFLVGAGVRYGAHLGNHDEGFAQGVLASVMAIGAIVVAKFLLFSMLVGGSGNERLAELADQVRYDDESMIASTADEIAGDMMERGESIQWPPGMTYDDAARKADYPDEIWQAAETKWNGLGAEQQEEKKRELRVFVELLSGAAAKPSFGDFFSPWDLLWFGLAVVTAYRIGVGTYGND